MKLLRLEEILEVTGLSRASIYREMSQGNFPRQVKLAKRAVAWRKKDVKKWIKSRVQVA